MEVADVPEKIQLALLKQKLGGAPAELLRLERELRKQDFKEMMGWLAMRYQEMNIPTPEQRKWVVGDTPDIILGQNQEKCHS